MKILNLISLLIVLFPNLTWSQNQNEPEPGDYLNMKWRKVATKMPPNWYGSEEAKLVADNLLIYQKDVGGWTKNKNFHRTISVEQKAKIIQKKSEIGATFDNGATIQELRFLAKVYSNIKDEKYKMAFEKGFDYIIISQYENGGWPQFYPLKGGYPDHITYNDNAMANTLNFLNEIISDDKEFASLQLDDKRKVQARKAFNKGIECILNTQITAEGKPTVWCAQHHEISLAPAKARSYELPSFSGAESVGITLLLMNIENPSDEIITAVNGAVSWFENHKIEGTKLERIVNEEGKRDRIVVEDPSAPTLWGRFCDLESGQVFFCDRDGIKKDSLSEIGHNRRNGYSWYTRSPKKVLDSYPEWQKRVNVN